MRLFKRNKKNTLTIYESDFLDSDHYLIPASSNLPDFWKSMPRSSVWNKKLYAKSCYSFNEIFKNSFYFVTPCEIKIIIQKTGYFDFELPHSFENFFDIQSHTHNDSHNQLGENFNKNLLNLKFIPYLKWTASRAIKVVYMPSFYSYSGISDMDFIAAPGASEIHHKMAMDINFNTFFDLSKIERGEEFNKIIPKGTKLGLLYFPSGRPKIVKKSIRETKDYYMFFNNVYNKATKSIDEIDKNKKSKCPFHF